MNSRSTAKVGVACGIVCCVVLGVLMLSPIDASSWLFENGVSGVSLGRFATWPITINTGDTEYYEDDLFTRVYADRIIRGHKGLVHFTSSDNLQNAWTLYFGTGPEESAPFIEHFEDVPNSAKIWPEEQNWVYKKFAVIRADTAGYLEEGGTSTATNYPDKGFTYTVSLNNLCPGTRVQSKYPTFYLENTGHGFGYLAWMENETSVVAGDFAGNSKPDTLDVRLLTENWMLLFDSSNDALTPNEVQIPVLVSFSHRPLEVVCGPEYITFTFDKQSEEEATVFLSLPYGIDAVDRDEVAENWTTALPDKVVMQCRLVNRMVNNWPVAVDEDFAFEDDPPRPPRVVVRNTFSFDYMGTLWSGNGYVPTTPYALIPPVLGLAHDGGLDVDLPASADSILSTKNGPLYLVDGSATCDYVIPGAPEHDIHLVGSNRETEWKQRVDRSIDQKMLFHEMHGVAGVGDPTGNWGQFPSLSMATSETRDRYIDWMERVNDEIVFVPNGQGQFSQWNWNGVEDPPSGTWPSFYAFLYAGVDNGRRISVPGDIDAQSGMVLEYLYESALWTGDWADIDGHWNTGGPSIQDIFKLLQLFQDWSFMASFHDVYGGEGCHMDMFAAQLAGYDAFAKMAAALGHSDDERLGRYLAAKAQIPFVTRWIAKEYVSKYYYTMGNDQIIAGFGEYETSGPLRGEIFRSFDGWGDWTVSGERISLLGYDVLDKILDAPKPESDPFKEALVRFSQEQKSILFPNLEYMLASFCEDKLYAFMKWRDDLGMSRDSLIGWVNTSFSDKKEAEPNGSLRGATRRYRNWKAIDWRAQTPGYEDHNSPAQRFPLMPAIVEAYGVPVRIGSWAPAKLVSADYNPDTYVLTAHFEQGTGGAGLPNPVVRLQADSEPTNVSVTGGGGYLGYDPLWGVTEVQLTGSGPWTLTATVTPGSGSWQTVDPQPNIANDPGFEESGYGRPNLTMAWRQWVWPFGYGQINTTGADAQSGTHSARLKIEDDDATSQIWQYIWWGDGTEADVHFWYKIPSNDIRIQVQLNAYPNELGHPAATYRNVDTLTYSADEPGWRSFSWRGSISPGHDIAALEIYEDKDPAATWVPDNAHEVFIDGVIVKRTVACTVGTVNVATTYVSASDTWTATFTFDTSPDTLDVMPVVSCSPAGASCPSASTRIGAGTLGTHHVIQVTGLKPVQDYSYAIYGCGTIATGQFSLAGGPASIRDITHSFIPETCKIRVNWKTKFLSHDNQLKYRVKGTTPWGTVDATQADCSPARYYTAYFAVVGGTTYQFKVVTQIEDVTYESSIDEQAAGRCDDIIPIDPTSTPEPVKPFISAHPNPFNPTTTVSFGVPSRMNVEIKVYAADGSYVATLASRMYDRGIHTVEWNATNNRGASLASGIYFVKLNLGREVLTSKIVLLR